MVPSSEAGTVPNTPVSSAISSFCMSRAQNAATRSPMAFIGSEPASAAARLDDAHIFCRKMVVDTSLLDPIFAGVIFLSSRVGSDSPFRSSKNGMLCVLAASLASLSNSALLVTMPHWNSADSSIVLLMT